MNQWDNVPETRLLGKSVKLYRPLTRAARTVSVPTQGRELDHLAFEYMGSELDFYRVLDTNWIEFMEERGDMDRIQSMKIPVEVQR